MNNWSEPVKYRRPPFSGIAFSAAFHALIFGAVATISIPITNRPARPAAAAGFTEIVIDKKLYYITPLSAMAAERSERAVPTPASSARKQEIPKAEPPPALEARVPKVQAPFIPPEIRRETPRKEVLVQADLENVNVSPDAQLPTFQAWTGRLAPYRRDFVVPGQRSYTASRTVDLQVEMPVNPVLATSAVSMTEPKLKLAAPPPVDEDLPALEIPSTGLQNGTPVNVISATNRATAPPRILVPPDNFAPKSEKAGFGTEEDAASASSASGRGTPSGSTRAAAGSDPVAVRSESTRPSSDLQRNTPSSSLREDGFITRSPQGKFDSVVVQSSPLDQFPSGNTLLRGRPIYTVFVSVGSSKDWAMYFSVPSDAPNSGTQPKAVEPPYPYRILRPKVTIPSYQKYVLVRGTITETGGLRDLQMAAPVSKQITDAVLSAVNQWTIRPAARLGAAIAVEFVLAIPAGSY